MNKFLISLVLSLYPILSLAESLPGVDQCRKSMKDIVLSIYQNATESMPKTDFKSPKDYDYQSFMMVENLETHIRMITLQLELICKDTAMMKDAVKNKKSFIEILQQRNANYLLKD